MGHEKFWYAVGIIGKEILSAILWAWLILACIARDPGTALMILVLRSLIWVAADREFRR